MESNVDGARPADSVVFQFRISILSAGASMEIVAARARLPRADIEFERILMDACIILSARADRRAIRARRERVNLQQPVYTRRVSIYYIIRIVSVMR